MCVVTMKPAPRMHYHWVSLEVESMITHAVKITDYTLPLKRMMFLFLAKNKMSESLGEKCFII